MSHFGDHQYGIYLRGMMGQRPPRPIDLAELERRASEILPRGQWGYIAGAAGSEDTARANLEAMRAWRIVPRMLRDVSERSLERTVLGTTMPAPVMLAPIGVQTHAHPDGERAAARAAAEVGLPFIASSASSCTMEQVAEACGENSRWYQLYWPRSRELAASFIARAEQAGYSALVVTLDTWLLGWRPRDLDQAFLPFLWGEGNANYLEDPVFQSLLEKPVEEDRQAAIGQWALQFANPTITWEDLAFLRECTDMPIVLKGIQHPADAELAVEHGMDGIICSNHGGRQVDGALGSLDALAPIVKAVSGRCEILFDSGIRSGADALKALALGARAVLLGRPYLWGLALGGQAGVEDVLRGFLADLDLALALSGHATIDELDSSALLRASTHPL